MDPDRFRRAEELFHQALAMTPAERDEFVQHGTGGDGDLVIHVNRLIRFAERASATAGLLRHDLDEDEDDRRLVGATAGPFLIGELLGKGGFGCVYRGEQREPIRRTVAVKVLRAGMDSQRIIARFESERHALALMDHPNIARVLDAGRTSPEFGSRPYFAMELVRGEPITSYCDEHCLTTTARLELFLTICQAVQHAHQKGIIHRDLKPSNILVSEIDGVATPKVIDFGIAKATQDATIGRAVTEAHQFLGTPQYMSPEQADMDVGGIDTRSDIYSLGVVLYELLTGSTPIASEALRGVSHSRMQRMIHEQTVERPSMRIMRPTDQSTDIARGRGTDLASLRRRLRGDLDWITLKALDFERDRRYASASAFADDIRRHLQHQPVLAGPPSALYRMRKFIRRHRVGVAAAALVALTLVAGAVVVVVSTLHVRDSTNQALQVNQFMEEVLTSPDPNKRGADVKLAEVLGTASATAGQRFAGHPELEARARQLLGRVYSGLAMLKQSEQEYRKAVELWKTCVGPDDPRTLNAIIGVGQCMVNEERGREAEEFMGDIIARVDRAVGRDDERAFDARGVVADAMRSRGRLDDAERLVRETMNRAASARISESLQLRLLNTLLGILRQKMEPQNRANDAADLEEYSALSQELLERSQRQGESADRLRYAARGNLADLDFRRRDFTGCAAQARLLLEESLPRLGECHAIRLAAMNTLAKAQNRLGEIEEPADLYLRMIACVRQETSNQSMLLVAHLSDVLPLLDRAGRWAEGEATAHEMVQKLQTMGGHIGTYMYDVYIAHFASHQGRLQEADDLFQALLKREGDVDFIERAYAERCYASHLVRRGQFEEAERRLTAVANSMDDVRTGLRDTFPDDVLVEFIALYEAWHKAEKLSEYQRLREEALRAAGAQRVED